MRKMISIASVLCTTIVLAGCGVGSRTDGPGGLSGGSEQAGLGDLINGVPPLDVPPEKAIAELSSETKTEKHETVNGKLGNFVCTYTSYSGTAQYQNLVSFDPQSDVLWPGSLVQGKSLPQGLLSPIGLARAPGKITISNIDVTGGAPDQDKYSRTLEHPSHASVQEAISDILSSASEVNFSAKADFTAEQVYSMSQAAYSAGLSLEWMIGDVKSKFDKSSWTESTNIMVKFTQAYYTVSFEMPSSPTSVFAPSVTAADAAPYIGAGNPPGYISSVVYGRMLLLRVESKSSGEELKIALNAALKKIAGKAEVTLTAEQKKVLDESNMTLFALGGSADDVIDIAANGADALEGYLAKGANFSPQSPGVPISYTVRQLSDNQAVKVAYTTDYAIPDCKVKANKLRVFLDYIKFNKNGDLLGKGENNYKVWVNDGYAEHVLVENFVNASNGEVFNEDKSIDIVVPQELGAKIQIGFWAEDTGAGAHEEVTATDTHDFDFQHATWSNLSSGLTLNDADGQLNVTIGYNLALIE